MWFREPFLGGPKHYTIVGAAASKPQPARLDGPRGAAAERTDGPAERQPRRIRMLAMTTGSIGISVSGSIASLAIRRTAEVSPTTRPSTA